MSSHHRTRSVVPIGGQPFISPYTQAMGAYQEDSGMASSSSSSTMGLGITITHPSHSSSSSGASGSSASPSSPHNAHHNHFGTSDSSSPSSPSSVSSSSSADAYTSISPDGQSVSPIRARHEAAMRYAAAMHSHTTAMWQEERDNIERARVGHGTGDPSEERWSVSGLLRGRSSRRKQQQQQVKNKDHRNSSRKA